MAKCDKRVAQKFVKVERQQQSFKKQLHNRSQTKWRTNLSSERKLKINNVTMTKKEQ
jgi:hypothetical protein